MGFEKMQLSEISESPKAKEQSDVKNQWVEHSNVNMDKVFTKVFEKFGLVKTDSVSDGADKTDRPNKNAYELTDEELYDELGLNEKTQEKVKNENGTENKDGSYTDNTGKTYGSFADWLRARYTKAERSYSIADFWEKKADKEWANYKNADKNGDSVQKKQKNYENSQKHYGDARKHRQAADAEMDVITGNKYKAQELSDQEREKLKQKLGWSDKQFNKCSTDRSGIIHYKTDCEHLEGKTSDNGTPYERKTVIISDVKIEGVFPVFDSIFDVQLPEDAQKSSNSKQFRECNQRLKEEVDKDPDLRKRFDENQIADIQSGRTPEGYVWHHNEEAGKMQLVKIEDHDRTQGGAPHTGGKTLWGGGYANSGASLVPDKNSTENGKGDKDNGVV